MLNGSDNSETKRKKSNSGSAFGGPFTQDGEIKFNGVVGVQYASKVLTKDLLLPPERLDSLGPEELAVVDWEILKQSRLAGADPLSPCASF